MQPRRRMSENREVNRRNKKHKKIGTIPYSTMPITYFGDGFFIVEKQIKN